VGQADIGSKRLLEAEPEKWVRWLLDDPDLQVKAVLSGEFQFVLRYNDVLLQVAGEQGSFLVLAESQLHLDPAMPRRVRSYVGLAEEKYGMPVYPVVFYWLPPGGEGKIPDYYHSEFMGLVAHQDFRVVLAWELDAREVLRREVMALVPFVSLMKGADEDVIREGVALLRRRGMGKEAEVVLGLFASFVMDPEQVRRIVRWNMAVLRESPWYREIIQEGLQQGIQQGLRQGLVEARRQDVLHLLRVRFGLSLKEAKEVEERLQEIEEPSLLQELVVEAAQAESLETFLASLDGKRVPA